MGSEYRVPRVLDDWSNNCSSNVDNGNKISMEPIGFSGKIRVLEELASRKFSHPVCLITSDDDYWLARVQDNIDVEFGENEIAIELEIETGHIPDDVFDLTWRVVEYDDLGEILTELDIDYVECKMMGCHRPRRTRGMSEYDGDYSVSVYGAKFCSTKHELKYDHIRADAKDAKRAEEEKRKQETLDKYP